MRTMVGVIAVAVAVAVVIWVNGYSVGAEEEEDDVYHLVGGDRGWDPSTDLAAWSSSTVFRIRDYVWFTYSRAEGKIGEVKTKEEYESCDVSNPIKMYTDGLNRIKLHQKGIRYFVSTNSNHCKNGLKLHMEVFSDDSPKVMTAAGPTPTPSGSASLPASANCIFSVAALCLFYSLFV